MIMMDYDVEYPSVKPVILPLTASFMLEVPILRGMAPSARILVYYVREDGEMVADSIKIKMKGCLQNEVGYLTFYREHNINNSLITQKCKNIICIS